MLFLSMISNQIHENWRSTQNLILAALVAMMLLRPVPSAAAGAVVSPYVVPEQQTKVAFGAFSHWAQPWRAFLETRPATTFLDGTGVNYNAPGDPDLVVQMLASHGMHYLRVEIGWGNVNYEDPTRLNNADSLRRILIAAKKYDCRPLILLNSHQGAPCPVRFFNRKVTAAAPAGSRTVQLDDLTDLKIGYSGLSQLTDYWAAEGIITAIDPATKTVTLSKPLPKAIAANATVPMATLMYRPFEPPTLPGGAPNPVYLETLKGWNDYVLTVARFVADTLKAAQAPDPAFTARFPEPPRAGEDSGFDMEVWNELTFGTHFLYVNDYYSPALYPGADGNAIWGHLVDSTAKIVQANPQLFAGVQVGNGFANTIPWPASSEQPPGISAIDKHPYAGRKTFPKDQSKGTPLNALLEKDTSGWVPTYTELFPEYFASLIQTETLMREASPLPTPIGRSMHGRNARVLDGKIDPVYTWITEVNIGPVEDDPKITDENARGVKALTTARYLAFYLNKGVTQMELFAAAGGDKDLGIVQDDFLKLAAAKGAIYPADDAPYTSPALKITEAIAREMRRGIDPTLTADRVHPLTLQSVADSGGIQFPGDPATASQNPNPHPALHDADVFAFLPFQVNSRRYVIPYYVVTRDVMHVYHPDAAGAARYVMPEETFHLEVGGIPGPGTRVSALDPLTGRSLRVRVTHRQPDSLQIDLPASSYPYLLEVER